MQSRHQLIEDIIHERKKVKIPIVNDENGDILGHLLPISVSIPDNDEIAKKMTDWRNRDVDRFLTKFTATPERTRNWLKNTVLTDFSRLLFLIYLKTNPTDKLIGYLGFMNLTESSVEGDTIIRGEHGGGIKFIHYANLACTRWFDLNFGRKRGISKILSTNEASLNMSLALGYKIEREVDIYLHEKNGEQMILEYGADSQLIQNAKLLYMAI